ncbi:MAG TPA: zinc ribbon domain-containing protein [Polyangiales bacterium]|jgi:putative FmdB family regulatory protein
MPLYEYVCRKCTREFEELVYDHKDPACPSCKSAKVERVLSRTAATKREAEPAPMGGCGRCSEQGGCGMN